MTLLLIFAVMTAVAVGAVLWPLIRNREDRSSGSDVMVYRDQLDEVERDLSVGLIGKVEAEAARVEISRRLLGAADAVGTKQPVSRLTPGRRRLATAVVLLALPTLAGGFYLRLGSPQLASAQQEVAPDTASAHESVEGLVTQVEAYLQRNPNDGHGWEILAPVYMRLNRYSDSVTAWRNALQLLGESAERDANLGESLTVEANGVVTADAKAAFLRAATLDNTLVTARYYLGLAAEQDGDRAKAAKIWRDLIAEAPNGAEWVADVRDALARVESSSGSASGPDAAKLAAPPANQSPERQSAMIHSMVERLAARLKQDGSDVEGWLRLVRSYKVLGEPDKVRAAITDAQQALATDRDKLDKLNAGLKSLDSDVVRADEASATPSTSVTNEQTATRADEAMQQAQLAMIHSMVERLAARLKQDGSDAEGWARLVHSYKVLGETDKALAASEEARQALAADPAKLQQLTRAIEELDENKAAPAGASTRPGASQLTMPGATPVHDGAAVENMIERLANRLKADGSDPAGWLMLVRSYLTLNEKDKAIAAIGSARQALTDDPNKLEQFDSALKNFNIPN
jgi:cytochrome c-type biogenesis protein CcmH